MLVKSNSAETLHCIAPPAWKAFNLLLLVCLFSVVQGGIYTLGKAHMRSIPSFRRFPNVAFETVPMFVWLTMALSCPFKEDRLALLFFHTYLLQPIIDVPAGSVSSSPTLQTFREASHLWGLLCQPVYLLGRLPSLRHVLGSTPTAVLEDECRSLTHSSLGFPFHFPLLFVAFC